LILFIIDSKNNEEDLNIHTMIVDLDDLFMNLFKNISINPENSKALWKKATYILKKDMSFDIKFEY